MKRFLVAMAVSCIPFELAAIIPLGSILGSSSGAAPPLSEEDSRETKVRIKLLAVVSVAGPSETGKFAVVEIRTLSGKSPRVKRVRVGSKILLRSGEISVVEIGERSITVEVTIGSQTFTKRLSIHETD